MDKSYRIHTNIINDTVLNVNMQQDFDFLEVLSLKLRQEDAYKLHSSNYGVIVGRVLANDAFGIPNAKVSLFIERDTNDSTDMETIYPYNEISSRDKDGRRYNTLPDYSDDECYRVVGTFPNKRLVLDDDVVLEVYDKYWKYTTVTNNAGDYMLFGVPSGSQQIHIDIDLSDIGILSQKPRDFEYKGYSLTMFDNPNQFKESTNLDGLAQLFSQNKTVFVYPFWGDDDNGIAAITRSDVQIQYKFEPTCVFMGSIVSDNDGNSIGHKCAPNEDNGMNDQLIGGRGTIEMIRKTTDGLVEEFQIQGNQLIDENGVWCYQIPMNLDYVGTDEYGNIVPTDNPNRGIPTRTQVRFRISKTETGNEGHSRHTAKYLVPMNPTLLDGEPHTADDGKDIEKMYIFGSNTPQNCFRDLYWNNVYSVKNYIPKIQTAHRAYSPNYSALKGSNLATDQNQIPFNKLRIDMPFMYIIVCILFQIVTAIVILINFISSIVNTLLGLVRKILEFSIKIPLLGRICFFCWLTYLLPPYIPCISLGGGLSPDNTAYYPGCWNRDGMDAAGCPDDMGDNCRKSNSTQDLWDLVQQKLALDFKIVKLDFYEDWLNGCLYMPLWYWRKRPKKTFLFGLFSSSAKNEFCDCDKTYDRLKSYITCVFHYTNNLLGVNDGVLSEGEESWHRKRSSRIWFSHGVIKGVDNKDGLRAYYYTAIQPKDEDAQVRDLSKGFNAVRLYATDIILLGNLNENNLYGIPQFYKALPSTTANVPPIATIYDGSDTDDNVLDKETLEERESGGVIATGMDWGHDGDEQTPLYRDGLLIDLNCVAAYTKAKSCINVERLSELGMSIDMTYDKTYETSNGPKQGKIESDGFITKYELDDIENRAMFATMNHLGFVPQEYQESIGDYDTQVYDTNTNYLINKFKYLYPVDLDGRMQPILDRYKSGFPYAMNDEKDYQYIDFRLGEHRMFYNGNIVPLYNNSFYFYFGVNKGKTAIDKFNSMFDAECFQNKKDAFTYDIETKAEPYCLDLYDNKEKASPYIQFTSDDIATPYTYVLVKEGQEESSCTNTIDSVKAPLKFPNDDCEEISGITNGDYTLYITDANGRSVKEEITLSMDKISFDYETRPMGVKWDESMATSTICANNTNGLITINSLLIDSYKFDIKGITSGFGRTEVYSDSPIEDALIIDVSGTCSGITSSVKRLAKIETTIQSEYLCSNGVTLDEGKINIRVAKPDSYGMKITQYCGDDLLSSTTSGNYTTQAVTVLNGSNFHGYLNTVPIEFLENKGVTDDAWVTKWLNVNRESGETIYNFPVVSATTAPQWKEFVNLTDIEKTLDINNIIYYKFNKIFSLSKVAYAANGGNNTFTFSAMGGVQPILYRSLIPYYKDDSLINSTLAFSDGNTAALNDKYPNIIGNNYSGYPENTSGATFNPLIKNVNIDNNREEGNLFAAFTNNGGYKNEYEIDNSRYVVHAPSGASVNITNEVKPLGDTEDIDDDGSIKKAFSGYTNGMFVDRRFDYDMKILAPVTDTTYIDIVEDISGKTASRQFACTRVYGTIYNGIEMSYDNEYNIISSNTVMQKVEEIKPETIERISATSIYTTSDNKEIISAFTTVVGSGYTKDEERSEDGKLIYTKDNDTSGDLYVIKNYYLGEDSSYSATPQPYCVKINKFSEDIIYNKDNEFMEVGEITSAKTEVRVGNVVVGYEYEWDSIGGNRTLYEVDNKYHYIWTEDEFGESTPNYYLEYSYDTRSTENESGVTKYTYADGGERIYVWESFDNDTSDYMCSMVSGTPNTTIYNVGEGKMPMVTRVPTYYKSNIRDIDTRLMYWSKQNEFSLDTYCKSSGNRWDGDSKFYIFNHSGETKDNTPLYNGIFGEDNYPTKRYFDIAVLNPSSNFSMKTTSCSHEGGIFFNEDNLIRTNMNEGWTWENNLKFGKVAKTSGTVEYNSDGEAVQLDLDYKYEYFRNNDYEIYTSVPFFITLGNVIKIKNTSGSPHNIINKCIFDRLGGNPKIPKPNNGGYDEGDWAKYPNNDDNDEEYFIYYDNDFLSNSDSRFAGTLVHGEVNLTGDSTYRKLPNYDGYPKIICSVVKRIYEPYSKDNLKKKLMVYEFCNFHDCRKIKFAIDEEPHEVWGGEWVVAYTIEKICNNGEYGVRSHYESPIWSKSDFFEGVATETSDGVKVSVNFTPEGYYQGFDLDIYVKDKTNGITYLIHRWD